jgi:hypothetical protein
MIRCVPLAALSPAFFLLLAPLYAGVDGIVTNGATGKPQAGSTVTLYQTTNQGPQNLGSVKTDAAGHFAFAQDVQPGVGGGPLLLQAVFDGVQYNKTIPPGQPLTGVEIPVFPASKTPGVAQIEQHFLILEPSPQGTMQVTEGIIYKNEGKSTWNDPDRGTFQFALPESAQDKYEINVTAPGGLPIRRSADSLAGRAHQFKVDFPIKPGQTEMQLSWSMPFNSPGVFEDHMLSKAAILRVVAPQGVEFKGDDVMPLGTGPANATIYSVKGPDIKFAIQGTGLFNQSGDQGSGDNSGSGSGQSLSENLPKLYGLLSANSSFGESLMAVKWILLTVLGMLALGFMLLYRKGNPVVSQQAAAETTKASTHARGRG